MLLNKIKNAKLKMLVSVVLVFVVLLEGLSYSKSKSSDEMSLEDLNKGYVLGCVFDAKSDTPIQDAKVSFLNSAGEFSDTVNTDENGCYRLNIPIGKSESKIDADKVAKSSILSIVINPKSVTRKTQIIMVSEVPMKIEKEGYKAFVGINKIIFGAPERFEVYVSGVKLALDSEKYSSFLVLEDVAGRFEITEIKFPDVFEEEILYPVEVTVLVPTGLYRGYQIKANNTDIYGLPYEGDKYITQFYLDKDDIKGKQKFTTNFKIIRKRLPKESMLDIAVLGGEERLASVFYPIIITSSEAEKQSSKYFYEGYLHFMKKEYSESERLFQQALDSNKTIKLYYKYLAQTEYLLGKKDDAIGILREEITLDPKDYHISVEIAKILSEDKKYSEAFKELSNIPKLRKKDEFVYLRYFEPLESLEKIKNGEEGKSDYTKAIGFLVNEVNDLEYADNLLEKAITLEPKFAEFHYERGLMLKKLGKTDEAQQAFEKAVELDPKNDNFKLTLANVYKKTNNCEKIFNLYEFTKNNFKQFYPFHFTGNCNLINEKVENALNDFSNAIKYAFSKEKMNIEGGKIEGATWYLGGELTPMVFSQEQTRVYYSGFSYPEANSDFNYLISQRAIKTNTQNALAYLQSGIALYNLSLHSESVKDLEKALSLNPNLIQGYYYLYKCYEVLGKTAERDKAQKKYLEMMPTK